MSTTTKIILIILLCLGFLFIIGSAIGFGITPCKNFDHIPLCIVLLLSGLIMILSAAITFTSLHDFEL